MTYFVETPTEQLAEDTARLLRYIREHDFRASEMFIYRHPNVLRNPLTYLKTCAPYSFGTFAESTVVIEFLRQNCAAAAQLCFELVQPETEALTFLTFRTTDESIKSVTYEFLLDRGFLESFATLFEMLLQQAPVLRVKVFSAIRHYFLAQKPITDQHEAFARITASLEKLRTCVSEEQYRQFSAEFILLTAPGESAALRPAFESFIRSFNPPISFDDLSADFKAELQSDLEPTTRIFSSAAFYTIRDLTPSIALLFSTEASLEWLSEADFQLFRNIPSHAWSLRLLQALTRRFGRAIALQLQHQKESFVQSACRSQSLPKVQWLERLCRTHALPSPILFKDSKPASVRSHALWQTLAPPTILSRREQLKMFRLAIWILEADASHLVTSSKVLQIVWELYLSCTTAMDPQLRCQRLEAADWLVETLATHQLHFAQHFSQSNFRRLLQVADKDVVQRLSRLFQFEFTASAANLRLLSAALPSLLVMNQLEPILEALESPFLQQQPNFLKQALLAAVQSGNQQLVTQIIDKAAQLAIELPMPHLVQCLRAAVSKQKYDLLEYFFQAVLEPSQLQWLETSRLFRPTTLPRKAADIQRFLALFYGLPVEQPFQSNKKAVEKLQEVSKTPICFQLFAVLKRLRVPSADWSPYFRSKIIIEAARHQLIESTADLDRLLASDSGSKHRLF